MPLRTVSLAALNHLLEGHDWARKALALHAGRCAEVTVPPVSVRFVVQADGRLAGAGGDETAEASITLPPFSVLQHLASGSADMADFKMEGDAELAAAIADVLRGLRWDAEEDLSQLFGDIAAHRMVSLGKALLSWKARAALSVGQSLMEYWTEENPLIARRCDIDAFSREVDETRIAMERLEQRVEALKNC